MTREEIVAQLLTTILGGLLGAALGALAGWMVGQKAARREVLRQRHENAIESLISFLADIGRDETLDLDATSVQNLRSNWDDTRAQLRIVFSEEIDRIRRYHETLRQFLDELSVVGQAQSQTRRLRDSLEFVVREGQDLIDFLTES